MTVMPTATAYPTMPAQAAFRRIDRAALGLTTVVHERRIRDDVIGDVLESAMVVAARRHEVMRTTITGAGHGLEPSSPEFLWRGFENVIAPEAELGVEHLTAAEARRRPRADPSRLPVFRFQLLHADDGLRWRLVTDHALCDRWSLLVLGRDIGLAYRRLLDRSEVRMADAPPFSAFVTSQYERWRSGAFADEVAAIEDRFARLPVLSLPAAEDRGRWPLTRAFTISLSSESTRRFEATRTAAGSTRFASATALFVKALGRELGWRELVFVVPHANRSMATRESVGLLADHHYLFSSCTAPYLQTAQEIAATLRGLLTRPACPMALVQTSPRLRDILPTVPRITVEPHLPASGAEGRERPVDDVFGDGDEAAQPDEDEIRQEPTPLMPVQPDLKLRCEFARRHRFSISYRVDRLSETAAASLASGLLDHVHRGDEI